MVCICVREWKEGGKEGEEEEGREEESKWGREEGRESFSHNVRMSTGDELEAPESKPVSSLFCLVSQKSSCLSLGSQNLVTTGDTTKTKVLSFDIWSCELLPYYSACVANPFHSYVLLASESDELWIQVRSYRCTVLVSWSVTHPAYGRERWAEQVGPMITI